jgi:hypothetical protein
LKINDITTFYDKILIAVIIIASLVMLVLPFFILGSNESENLYLLVQQNNDIVKEIPLADSYEEPIIFKVEGPIGIHTIEVINGRVRVKEAPKNDPLKICEKTGWIDREGPIIVCVPNKLSIWIESNNSDIDGMSW